MPYCELLGWLAYFEKRPIEWRDDDRTFKLLQAQGIKEKPGNVFSSLNSIYNRLDQKPVDTIDTSFKSSVFYHKIVSARDGEKISW